MSSDEYAAECQTGCAYGVCRQPRTMQGCGGCCECLGGCQVAYELTLPTVVVNPEAIGDPNQEPLVFVGADLRALLNPCECGGVNGFHRDSCAVWSEVSS